MDLDKLEKHLTTAIRLKDSSDRCSLNSKDPDIYVLTDKVLAFFKECWTDIKLKGDDAHGIYFYQKGFNVIDQVRNEELTVLPKHKNQRDKILTFNSVKKNLIDYLHFVIHDLEVRIKEHKTG